MGSKYLPHRGHQAPERQNHLPNFTIETSSWPRQIRGEMPGNDKDHGFNVLWNRVAHQQSEVQIWPGLCLKIFELFDNTKHNRCSVSWKSGLSGNTGLIILSSDTPGNSTELWLPLSQAPTVWLATEGSSSAHFTHLH